MLCCNSQEGHLYKVQAKHNHYKKREILDIASVHYVCLLQCYTHR